MFFSVLQIISSMMVAFAGSLEFLLLGRLLLGIAIGGALVGYMLAWGDYVGGAAQQTDSALQMIALLFTVFPGVLVALLIVIMSKYSLDDKRLSRLAQDDLPA